MPAPRDLFQFRQDLKAFAEHVGVSLTVVRRKVALDLFSKVTLRSPVDTGRFRGSWALSDSEPAGGALPPGQYPADAAAQNITAEFRHPYDSSWVVNNLPYGLALEFGRSDQAPVGMVRISMAELEAELQSVMQV